MSAFPCSANFSAGHQNLTIQQGDDWARTVHVYKADGTDADITGFIARAQIREAVADVAANVIVEISCTVESPLIRMSIPRAETLLMTGESYVWDLEVQSTDDQVTTLLSGGVTVKLEVTREAALLPKRGYQGSTQRWQRKITSL